jgi:hypothetical protein
MNALGSDSQTFTIVIAPAPLTITADPQTRTYGAATPALTYRVSGLVNGDTASVLSGALATSATVGSPVGSYPITQGSLSAGGNYTLSFIGASLLITTAAPSPTYRYFLPLIVR